MLGQTCSYASVHPSRKIGLYAATRLEGRCAVMVDMTQCTGRCSCGWEELDDVSAALSRIVPYMELLTTYQQVIVGSETSGLTGNAIPGRSSAYALLVNSFMSHFILADGSEQEIKVRTEPVVLPPSLIEVVR